MTPATLTDPSRSKAATGVRHPMSVVMRVRELREAGWMPKRIQQMMAEEGVQVSVCSIYRWTDEKYAEKVRQSNKANARKVWANRWTFQLQSGHGVSTEYQQAFILRLIEEGCGVSEIVRLCNVVLPGKGWTRHRVDYLLKTRGKAPQTRWNHRRTA